MFSNQVSGRVFSLDFFRFPFLLLLTTFSQTKEEADDEREKPQATKTKTKGRRPARLKPKERFAVPYGFLPNLTIGLT